jgi:hypothetical protein
MPDSTDRVASVHGCTIATRSPRWLLRIERVEARVNTRHGALIYGAASCVVVVDLLHAAWGWPSRRFEDAGAASAVLGLSEPGICLYWTRTHTKEVSHA